MVRIDYFWKLSVVTTVMVIKKKRKSHFPSVHFISPRYNSTSFFLTKGKQETAERKAEWEDERKRIGIRTKQN